MTSAGGPVDWASHTFWYFLPHDLLWPLWQKQMWQRKGCEKHWSFGACLVALRPSILGQVAGGWANREKASWMCQWRPSLSSQSQWVSVGRCTTQHSPDYTMPDETRSHTQVDVDIGWKTHYFKSHHGVLVGYFVTRLKPMDILDN